MCCLIVLSIFCPATLKTNEVRMAAGRYVITVLVKDEVDNIGLASVARWSSTRKALRRVSWEKF